jgi:ABC-type Fe3+-hydroxamate transport system substrate-binding protein
LEGVLMAEFELEKLFQLPDWEAPPERVISLVPSMTANLFELGFGGSVVGITDYCTRPAEKLLDLVRVGGPKAVDFELIEELKPDLVIVNQEESSPEIVEKLLDDGHNVWMVFPKTVQESIDVLRSLLALYHTDQPVIKINSLQMAVDYAAAAAEMQPKIRYFCPIWVGTDHGLDWYMTFNHDTYMSDVLQMFGGENVFAARKRRYPLAADLGLEQPTEEIGTADQRYPRVTVQEVLDAAPELILIPDEPCQFIDADKENLFRLFADTPAVLNKNVHFIDGSLIIWDGVRLGAAFQTLPEYFNP